MNLFKRAQNLRLGEIANGVVVQLVRMPACHAGGRGFESRPLRLKASISEAFFMCNFFLLAGSSLPAGMILKLNFLGVKCDETSIFIVTINGGRSRPLRRNLSD